METERIKETEKNTGSIVKIIAVILLLTSLAFIITIWLVGILPFKYAIVLSALIAVIAAIILFFLIRSGKGALRTFLIVDTLMISAILCLGSYLLNGNKRFCK